MGRIKTTLIKRVTREIMKAAGSKFTTDFEKNKKKLGKLIESKKIRNSVAGYIARLKKAELKKAEALNK
jgi:ribosomal protein S17E